jgi:hypothetical protein
VAIIYFLPPLSLMKAALILVIRGMKGQEEEQTFIGHDFHRYQK